MINETSMQSALILSQVEIDLSKHEDQVIELTEMGVEFFIDKIIIASPSVLPVSAMGIKIYDEQEKGGKYLFTSTEEATQHDVLLTLKADTNYCSLKVPLDGFPFLNNSHIVKTNKLYLSIHSPQRNLKVKLYVLGYILK